MSWGVGLFCLCLTLAGAVLAGMAWENNDHDD